MTGPLPPQPPSDPAAQLQWLVDRAAIAELFFAFGRAIDEQNQPAYAETFTDDGVLTLPHCHFEGKAAIRAMRGPPPAWGTHHIQGNHHITLAGDTATARVYVIASHTFERAVLDHNARAGGWYDAELRRTADGWRIARIGLTIVWNTGEMVPPSGAEPNAAKVPAP